MGEDEPTATASRQDGRASKRGVSAWQVALQLEQFAACQRKHRPRRLEACFADQTLGFCRDTLGPSRITGVSVGHRQSSERTLDRERPSVA